MYILQLLGGAPWKSPQSALHPRWFKSLSWTLNLPSTEIINSIFNKDHSVKLNREIKKKSGPPRIQLLKGKSKRFSRNACRVFFFLRYHFDFTYSLCIYIGLFYTKLWQKHKGTREVKTLTKQGSILHTGARINSSGHAILLEAKGTHFSGWNSNDDRHTGKCYMEPVCQRFHLV